MGTGPFEDPYVDIPLFDLDDPDVVVRYGVCDVCSEPWKWNQLTIVGSTPVCPRCMAEAEETSTP